MKKVVSLVLLLLVIFISLALSTLPIFYSIKNTISEGFKEGLISTEEIAKVQALLETYNTNLEKMCKDAVLGKGSPPSGGLKNIAWDQKNDPTAKSITGQPGVTYTNMVQQILTKIKPMDSASKAILDTVLGQMYSETLTLLNGIIALNITDDTTFMTIVTSELETPVVLSKGAAVSSYEKVNKYINGTSAA